MYFVKNKLEKSHMEETPILKMKRNFGFGVLRVLILRRKVIILEDLTIPKIVKGGIF